MDFIGDPFLMRYSIGSYQEPPNLTHKRDTTALEEKLLLKDYCSIISNSELFLALFYKACASLAHAHEGQHFRVSQAGRTITIFGKEHNKKDFETGVEQIRALVEKNYPENKQCTIVPIEVTQDVYFRAPSPEEIDLENWLAASSGGIMGHIYEDYILPSMPFVAKSIGAIYNDTVVEQRWRDTGSNIKKIKSFTVKFLESDHFVYPIPPVQISKRESMAQSMYALYKAKDQPLCTLTLRPGTGKEIKMHSLPLYLYGGEMMQKMLTNGFSEASTETIVMADFSEEVNSSTLI